MARMIMTDEGMLVIPGGDPPPTTLDQLLFPEGEVAPSEVAADLLPPEPGLVCKNCHKLRVTDPNAVAVNCGNHVWVDHSDL